MVIVGSTEGVYGCSSLGSSVCSCPGSSSSVCGCPSSSSSVCGCPGSSGDADIRAMASKILCPH